MFTREKYLSAREAVHAANLGTVRECALTGKDGRYSYLTLERSCMNGDTAQVLLSMGGVMLMTGGLLTVQLHGGVVYATLSFSGPAEIVDDEIAGERRVS